MGNRTLDILFLCHFSRSDAQTIVDHCQSFEKYSKYHYYYIDPVGRSIPFWIDINKFDVLIVHYSLYTISNYYLDETWVNAIRTAKSLRVMFIQDEYRRVNEFTAKMRQLKINLLYTCVPEYEIEKVYPDSALPNVVKVNNLTGYVPESLERVDVDFYKKRPIDVGYRGRALGYWYGDLGQEKGEIAEKFLEYATQQTNLKCDISSREEDRIYGEKWVEFLKSCKCTLGTESGASVFDFTGEIEKNVTSFLLSHPDAKYKEVKALFFEKEDGAIFLNQISPRCFEAICNGSCLVLFEGEYSGILTPNVHYIPLKKDFSNFEEVYLKIKNDELCQEIAKQAYIDIIESSKYSYKQFVRSVDDVILGLLDKEIDVVNKEQQIIIYRRVFNCVIVPIKVVLVVLFNIIPQIVNRIVVKIPWIIKSILLRIVAPVIGATNHSFFIKRTIKLIIKKGSSGK